MLLPNPCTVYTNIYPSGTYKHDFIEWWNLAVARNRGKEVVLGELFAEATECAISASIYGAPPKGETDE